MSDQTTVTPTPDATGVNSTLPANGVNPAQSPSPTEQIINNSALIANYEQRLRALMSEKDKAINERNQAISAQTSLQEQLTTLQNQTSSSLTASANSAQQAIDRATQLEQEVAQARAENTKLTALMQRPHLAPYANLIPSQGDAATITAALDQLEQIRKQDLEQYAKQNPSLPSVPSTPPMTPQNPLQALYGNRANMNPALFQQNPTIPGSTPAAMNPTVSDNPTAAVEAIFAEAQGKGPAAFEEAVKRAAAFVGTQYTR